MGNTHKSRDFANPDVDQYGQIYLKNKMVKFVIDKTVQCETILYSLDSLCWDTSVHFELNYVTPFTDFPMSLSARQL